MRDYKRVEEVGMDAESRERRASNRERSSAKLEELGIAYLSNNAGAHLIVHHNGKTVDFWPGTGKYIPRGFGKPGRGVFNLLKILGATDA